MREIRADQIGFGIIGFYLQGKKKSKNFFIMNIKSIHKFALSPTLIYGNVIIWNKSLIGDFGEMKCVDKLIENPAYKKDNYEFTVDISKFKILKVFRFSSIELNQMIVTEMI